MYAIYNQLGESSLFILRRLFAFAVSITLLNGYTTIIIVIQSILPAASLCLSSALPAIVY